MTKKESTAQAEAIVELKKTVKQGDTVYTILKHVSSSGMLRVIDCYIIKENKPLWISFNVAKALGATLDQKKQGVRIGGVGMDMGYHLVNQLSYTLGYNNDENGRIKGTPDEVTNCYGLNHRWL